MPRRSVDRDDSGVVTASLSYQVAAVSFSSEVIDQTLMGVV